MPCRGGIAGVEIAVARDTDIQVLLATYNGQRHLPKLLDSIFNQTLKCNILARDDGSTDGTSCILKQYAERVQVVEDIFGNVGARDNFNRLMMASTAPYVALADQDDVWEPDRLEAGMAIMIDLEERFGRHHPLLVHSDLRVCDADGNEISSSLWKFQHLNPEARSFSRLLVQNNVTGCTVLINRALMDLALPVPQEAIMHDWWLALVAAAAGNIDVVQRPLVEYRQHGHNQLGAVRSDCRGVFQRLASVNPRISLRAAQTQAGAFFRRYVDKNRMEAAVAVAEVYANIALERYPIRLWQLAKHGLWKQDLWRNIGLILFV